MDRDEVLLGNHCPLPAPQTLGVFVDTAVLGVTAALGVTAERVSEWWPARPPVNAAQTDSHAWQSGLVFLLFF